MQHSCGDQLFVFYWSQQGAYDSVVDAFFPPAPAADQHSGVILTQAGSWRSMKPMNFIAVFRLWSLQAGHSLYQWYQSWGRVAWKLCRGKGSGDVGHHLNEYELPGSSCHFRKAYVSCGSCVIFCIGEIFERMKWGKDLLQHLEGFHGTTGKKEWPLS